MTIIRPDDISKVIIKRTLEGGFVLINQSKDFKSYFIIPCKTLVSAQNMHSVIYKAKPGEKLHF